MSDNLTAKERQRVIETEGEGGDRKIYTTYNNMLYVQEGRGRETGRKKYKSLNQILVKAIFLY